MTFLRITAVSLAVLGVAALIDCSSPDDPHSAPPTVFVTNPLCDTTGCDTIQVRAFVWAFTIPQPIFGLKVLGKVPGSTACLQFPPSWTVTIREVDSTGVPVGDDSTVYAWTPDHPDGLFLTGNTVSPVFPFAATETFIPADAPGWDLSFSRDSANHFTAHLNATDACEPPQ